MFLMCLVHLCPRAWARRASPLRFFGFRRGERPCLRVYGQETLVVALFLHDANGFGIVERGKPRYGFGSFNRCQFQNGQSAQFSRFRLKP